MKKMIFLLSMLLSLAGYSQTTKPEDTDISALDNTIYIESLQTESGSEVVLSVKMKNTIAVVGYQFDLYLPDGVNFVTDSNGKPVAVLSTSRTTEDKTNFFETELQEDGALRVLCSSTNGATFSGADGEVARITVSVGNDMSTGDYAARLENIELTDAGWNSYDTDEVIFTFSIESAYVPGDVNKDQSVTIADVTALVNILSDNDNVEYDHNAADVDGKDGITEEDVTALVNMILNQ